MSEAMPEKSQIYILTPKELIGQRAFSRLNQIYFAVLALLLCFLPYLSLTSSLMCILYTYMHIQHVTEKPNFQRRRYVEGIRSER